MTFKDIPIGNPFVSTPAETLYLKLQPDALGRNAFDMATGKESFIPDDRCVSIPKKTHVSAAAKRFTLAPLLAKSGLIK